MKNFLIFVVLVFMTIFSALAEDQEIVVKNTDGVDISYKIATENTVEVAHNDYSGTIKIPSVIKVNDQTYTVTSIGDFSFSGCKTLKSVIIPNTVTSIGAYAFSNCESLESVNIPKSVTLIDFSAFTNCKSLISISIPNSVSSIGDFAFKGCISLSAVVIPESVTYLGNSAFCDCI